VAALDELAPRYESGSVLFLGLAATFLLLTRLPDDPKRWAIYPAVAFVVLEILGLSVGGNWLLALALVGVGVYLLYRRGEGDGRAVAVGDVEPPQAAEPAAAGAVENGEARCEGSASEEPASGEPASEGPDAERPDAARQDDDEPRPWQEHA